MQQKVLPITDSRTVSPALERRGIQNHEGFFAPYYLFELLERRHAEELDPTGRESAYSMLKRLFRYAQRNLYVGTHVSFERTWTYWYKELFTILGFSPLSPLEPLETARHGLVPISHAFYFDTNANESPLVLIDLHPFGFDLDRHRYPNPTRHPDITKEPVSRAIELALDYNQTRWALLSNGKELRLYRRDSSVARQYLKVDFFDLFEYDYPKDWLVFWGLFRRAAFVPQPSIKQRGEDSVLSSSRGCLLDLVNEESQRHATKIADDLRENVVNALENLLQGVIESPKNSRLWEGTSEVRSVPGISQLKALFDESMYFLYRLLFILYAESRDLLPMSESVIYEDTYSLEHLRELAEKPLKAENYESTYYIETIRTLFAILRKGYPIRNPRATPGQNIYLIKGTSPFYIPPYNGKLFDQDRTPLLDKCHISDRVMREVIRELSLSRPKSRHERRERYSYADLGIDQLGSIYEGLLVYEPSIADRTMVEAKIKGELCLIPLEEANTLELEYDSASIKPAGSFILRIWGGRRKSTGSYYTPQEITAFLVKDALEPLVEPIIQGCSQRDQERKPLRRAEEILKIKVCDPAMGSGAFLVQACRYLGEAYRRALTGEEQRENTRMEINELARYKRRVAETCLYGVDLNPLAVELAKVSLWLETLAWDRPLTFLDSHLRCGNALIGAPLRDQSGKPDPSRLSVLPTEALGKAAKEDTRKFKDQLKRLVVENREQVKQLQKGQLTLFSDDEQKGILATYERLRLKLEESDEGKSLEEAVTLVHQKHDLFRGIFQRSDSSVNRFKRVCDLWCAAWFWPTDADVLPPTTLLYRELVNVILQRPGQFVPANATKYFETVQKIIEANNFFHWELEFPEIWYDEEGNTLPGGGFDVVVGNPPWDFIVLNSKEFWSNYLPTFRSLGKQAALRAAERLRIDPEIDNHWRKYCKFCEQQNNLFKLGNFFTKQGSGHLNTYKLFLEQMVHLTRVGGIFSMVMPSGIYTDKGCTALRHHLFTEQKSRFVVSVENRREIFPIDSRMKVVLLSGQKSDQRDPEDDLRMIECLFLIGKDTAGGDLAPTRREIGLLLPQLERHLLRQPIDTIRKLAPGTLSLMEFKDQHEIELTRRIYSHHPLLGSKIEIGWNAPIRTEFNMTTNSDLFEEQPGGWPLYEGKMIYQFTCDYAQPGYWIDEKVGIAELTRRAELEVYQPPREWVADEPKLGCANFRLVYRDVASGTNEITSIAAILPPYTFIGNTLIEFVQWTYVPEPRSTWIKSFEEPHKLYLASLLNSFVLNFIIRKKVSAHVSMFLMEQLPVPRLPATHPVIQALVPLAGHLICIDEQFALLWEELARYCPDTMAAQWGPDCAAKEPMERAQLRAEIDARVADLYGLSEHDFAYILSTFPLLDRAQPALPGEPKSFITRDLALLALFQLRNKKPPADIISFFNEAGVHIRHSTGSIISLIERVCTAGQKLGAVAYQPSGRETDEYVDSDQAMQETFDFSEEGEWEI